MMNRSMLEQFAGVSLPLAPKLADAERSYGYAVVTAHGQSRHLVRFDVEWPKHLSPAKGRCLVVSNPPYSTTEWTPELLKSYVNRHLKAPNDSLLGSNGPSNARRSQIRRTSRPALPFVLHQSNEIGTPPLLTAMSAVIEGWTDLSLIRRRELRSAVAAAIKIDAFPDPRTAPKLSPQPATMSCAYLNTRLFRQAHAIYGIKSPARFANILSQLRFALRRLGLHEPLYGGASTLHPSWQRLHDILPTEHRQIALSGFMRFCSRQAIAPEAVSNETLAAFEISLLERTLCKDVPVRARAVASNWTWARAKIAGWPAIDLKRPRMREQYVLPLSVYPESLQADVQRYLNRLRVADLGDVFPDDADKKGSRGGLRKPLRPRTIQGREFHIRQALVALIKLGQSPTSLTSLQELVTPPQQAKAIMQFYLDRAGGQRTSQTAQIGELLRQLAKYHCDVSPENAAQIAHWASRAAPKRQISISHKNNERVRALRQPEVQRALLHLPWTLMQEAADPELRPREAGLLAMYATALAVLFTCPMRRSNLAQLRLDQHLRYDAKRRLVTDISLPPEEHKTGNGMLWPVGKPTAELIQQYLRTYRPKLALSNNVYLFPNTKLGSRSAHDLAVGLTDIVQRRIGREFNLHLVRHFAAALLLEHYPGQYETLKKLLGHSATGYTIGFYAPFAVDSAAKLLDQALTIEREGEPLPPKPKDISSGSRGRRQSSPRPDETAKSNRRTSR